MRTQAQVALAPLTTLRVGGPARALIRPSDREELVGAVRELDARGEPLMILAGGSNVVIADEGVDATVVHVTIEGVEVDDGRVVVQAGHSWDDVVRVSLDAGLAGLECLSGIPGSAGATPIQNVGAYGQEIAEHVVRVTVLDRTTGQVVDLAPAQCGFGYRTSVFRGDPRHVVLEVELELARRPDSGPLRYAELSRALEVEPGAGAPAREVREAVLALRRAKGMVVDASDPDSVSVGSFFTNPVVAPAVIDAVARAAGEPPPAWPAADGLVKTSAAWLIERAGIERGHGAGAAGISTKHTLAIVNRGGARAGDVIAVAREVRERVQARFGVLLEPEPMLVGVEL